TCENVTRSISSEFENCYTDMLLLCYPFLRRKSLVDKFRVGLVQMSATPDPDKNLQRAIDRLHQAAAKGAQIVCLPELFRTQYFCQREDTALFDLAEPIPGPTSTRLSEVAKQLKIVLVAS